MNKDNLDKDNLVCVICGEIWGKYNNLCHTCGGFCTWGKKKGGPPSSWNVNIHGEWNPNSPPDKYF